MGMYVGMNEISRNLTKANASNKRMYEVCSMEEGAVSKYLIAKNIGRDDNFTFLGMAAIICHDKVTFDKKDWDKDCEIYKYHDILQFSCRQ